ncbi:MAG: short-chain dehydrogenase [Deltaproteobacteria bacterium]|nr:MAG: short-chain dehydrogenase [Deltaproteobacteria bacterium]
MMEAAFDFAGKVAVVTGGSRGLGESIAVALAQRGAQVAVCGRKQESLDRAAERFKQKELGIVGKVANVGNQDQVEALINMVEESFGRLDILINNVGMNILTPSVVDAEEGLWNKIVQTNLTGTFLVTRSAVGLMKKSGGGKIINISSIAARKTAPGMGIYCVAKAGVDMFTRVLAVELARDNIQVNGVAPCMVKTPFSKPFWSNEGLLKQITQTIPMGRIAETEDVVGAVLFLASGLSNFITGEILTVDGGSTA